MCMCNIPTYKQPFALTPSGALPLHVLFNAMDGGRQAIWSTSGRIQQPRACYYSLGNRCHNKINIIDICSHAMGIM